MEIEKSFHPSIHPSIQNGGASCTVHGQDDCDVLLAEGAERQQHGRPLGGDEAEGHVLSGSAAALRGDAGRLGASVLHHREGLLERVDHRGLGVEGHGHLCAHTHTNEEAFYKLKLD